MQISDINVSSFIKPPNPSCLKSPLHIIISNRNPFPLEGVVQYFATPEFKMAWVYRTLFLLTFMEA